MQTLYHKAIDDQHIVIVTAENQKGFECGIYRKQPADEVGDNLYKIVARKTGFDPFMCAQVCYQWYQNLPKEMKTRSFL